ncbi:MAG: hypothetical protein KDD37_10100 [Bdellovibrionales bacterium]|nr:hypothetical protein [Bdellovibrionales bacterium]
MLQIEKWIQNSLDKVESLLLEKEEKVDQYFQASSQLCQSLKTLPYLPQEDRMRAKTAFGTFRENFEAGLLLHKTDKGWLVIDKFSHGVREDAPHFLIDLPEMTTLQVLRIHPNFFAVQNNKLHLPFFSKEANALLFKPCDSYAFILFSEFPNVILRYISDEIHEYLLKAFAY